MRRPPLRVVILLLLLLAPAAAAQTTLFFDNFTTPAAWTLGNEWQIGPATASAGQAVGNADPASDADAAPGGGLAGVVIGGNANPILHGFDYLISPPVNTSGYSFVELRFMRWLNSDYAPFMTNTVEVFDGTSWQVIFQTGPQPPVQDANWTPMSFDITAAANPALQVRFGFAIGNNGVYTVSSWNLDNVGIYGTHCASQRNAPAASLVVNEPTYGCGPYLRQVSVGSQLTLSWHGPPNQPFALFLGPLTPANLALPCIGTIDIGTPPFYADLLLVFDGTQANFPNTLFRLNAAGTAQQTFTIPTLPPGTPLASMQGVVVQGPTAPCFALLTAAFQVSVQ